MGKSSLLFITLFLTALGMCGEETASNAVETVKPQRRDLTKWIEIPGNTEAAANVELFARVSGFLRDFKLDIGDTVKPGDIIARIDAPELEQDVKLAEAQKASAQAEVKTAEANVKAAQSAAKAAQTQVERVQARDAEIDAKEAGLKIDVLKAKAELAKAQKQYERTQKLFSSNAATDLERENQELTVGVFQAGVAVAEGKLTALPSERAVLKKEVESTKAAAESAQAAVESTQAVVEAAKGKVGIAEATIQRAKVWQTYTQVTVPTLGLAKPATLAHVHKRFVSNGDLITAGTGARSGMQALVQLVVTDPIRVVADVPESDVGNVAIGTALRATFYGMEKEAPHTGKIVRVAPMISLATRTLRIEMDLPNADGKLNPGTMANVEIATAIKKDVLALPASAILTGKLGAVVYAVENGKAKKIAVKTGVADHGLVEVSAKELTETTEILKVARIGILDGEELVVSK